MALDRQDNHPGLAWLRESDAGHGWLASLPQRVEACAAAWRLRLGDPFEYAQESLVLPATRDGGTSVVLKLPFVGRENEHEADALAHWAGDGAVVMLDYSAEFGALLLERCLPGTPASDLGPQDALEVLIDVARRLSIPAGAPFRRLEEEARWWSSDLLDDWERAGRPFEYRFIRSALDAIEVLLSQPAMGAVLLHQDLHPGNVLRAERQPWLAIDAKPLVGDPAFAGVAIVRSFELGNEPQDVEQRLDRVADGLSVDRERLRLWSIAQITAWGIESPRIGERVKTLAALTAAG